MPTIQKCLRPHGIVRFLIRADQILSNNLNWRSQLRIDVTLHKWHGLFTFGKVICAASYMCGRWLWMCDRCSHGWSRAAEDGVWGQFKMGDMFGATVGKALWCLPYSDVVSWLCFLLSEFNKLLLFTLWREVENPRKKQLPNFKLCIILGILTE